MIWPFSDQSLPKPSFVMHVLGASGLRRGK